MSGVYCLESRALQKPFNKILISLFSAIFSASESERGSSVLPFDTERKASFEKQAERLLSEYGNSVLRLAYSYLHNMSDAEDVLQDTLIQYLKAEPRFETPSHEKAWLLRVAINISKNRIKYVNIRKTDELHENLAAGEENDLVFIWDAVKSLPPNYRKVIHLFYHEGYSTAMIASILSKNESTVRSLLLRARAKLKTVLKEAYDFE